MPELPEVEVVRAGLAPAVDGAEIVAVRVLDERSLRRHGGPAEDFVDRLVGRVLGAPERRGKFIWIPLDPPSFPGLVRSFPGLVEGPAETASALAIHLGMSGQVLLRERDVDDVRTRIRLDIVHPTHGELRVNFVDQRIFGSMAIVPLVPAADHPEQRIPTHVTHIARDPLDPLFDTDAVVARIRRRRSGIKRVLLDQTTVSGVGNIYADEALWRARLHYDQPADSLTRATAMRLLDDVRAVLDQALAEGGTSFDAQYVNVNGASGYFARSLNVYGQQGEPCPRCGTPIVRERFMNRGSHVCPRCQRPRAAA
ncbi:bifunctional DNA-formamidopyrimidine glycosylase/DNA-(apurinic or apyrimidinic site) lyase [Galbitalea sp. SE-J8]|uniref:bifunctional DNA-formamidopyrimidine glycosylase/DNA-(apurinic or apyrimidinic site) lyase n=1 Tax=Galbitalea sp. SE-J8 TaxID=3054952 RepID=UPI00259CA3B5|nr:bifunctional DNA-formamidopyrimidine glycosylase/DNA-(apurinic or apyrimidinic site) lyase [Galbitalea sp. SE-J8]MDM4762924.1 bifunctional DNA-formamidopyrimidine glycosylase/DNA-(apurinic or apyrimidinic site) lyase [Galbitalea sp. SE-J8]